MARVKQKAAKKGGGGAPTRGAQVSKQKNKHKVVLQGNPTEKKLPTVITFRADPPPGYTFIPAGNPELTAALKDFARKGDHKIYAVTTTPHAQRHELSREVHRIGFHFPTSVVAQVCAHYGIRLTRGGKLIDESKDDNLFMKVYQSQSGQRPVEKKDQVTINTDAKQTIKDLFPNIPDNDLFQIIKTAFQLGDNRVGTAEEVPLVRRAQLSVVAHIRHVYTQYDRLLRKHPYNEARHMVEEDTLKKLVEWRGDEDTVDEASQRVADDLLREVIVISDEEDTGSDSDDPEPLGQDHIQIEELPHQAYASGISRPLSPTLGPPRDEAPLGYPRPIRTYRPTDMEIAQRNQSRYSIWNQAKEDYRSSISKRPATVLERIYEPQLGSVPRVLVPLDQPQYPPTQIVRAQAPPGMRRIEYEPRPPPQPSPPPFIRDANGTLYERIDDRPREPLREVVVQRPFDRIQPHVSAARVRTRPSSPQDFAQRDSRYRGNLDGDDGTILPSIEGPDGGYLSPRARANPFDRRSEPRDANMGRGNGPVLRDADFVDLTSSPGQTSKRRRVDEIPPSTDPRMLRRQSPDRLMERRFVPQPQSRPVFMEPRPVEYGEPVRAIYDSRAPAVSQAPHALYHPTWRPEASSLPSRDVENQRPALVSRVYEPIMDSHDARMTRAREIPLRDEYERYLEPVPLDPPRRDDVDITLSVPFRQVPEWQRV